MIIVIALQLLRFLVQVRADYGCLCIRGGDSVIYYQPFLLSQVLGQLKDGDCKPTFSAGTSANWTAIQFHNQVGFITVTSAVRFYECQGNPVDTDASTRALQCPPQVHGYRLQFNGHCYEFIMTPQKNWPNAEHDCNRREGHLVSIGSMSEQNFIHNALKRLHDTRSVWIGLTDQDSEGHWHWTTGERTTFTYWDSGEPDTFIIGSNEDCAMLQTDRHGHWGDVSCTGFLFSAEQHGYICEYHLI